ncbi:MAG: FecR domain-containing protein [Rhizobacter sp.]
MRASVIRKVVCLTAGLLPLCAAAAVKPEAPTWSYRVTKGDSLYSVARTYLAPTFSWQKLARFNRVSNARRLAPGRELRMPLGWLRAEATVATVSFISGHARRETAGGAEPVALAIGDTLKPGDLLATDGGASVTLTLADASRVLVSGDSRVRMESLLLFGRSGVVSSRLGLERGEADSRINPAHAIGTRYDVRTPALTLGVRGTEFRVRVGDDSVAAEVTEGRVAAAPITPTITAAAKRGAERSIDAGFGLVAAPSGGIGSVSALPAAPNVGSLPTLYERVPLSFSWPPSPGATAYRAQVFADDSFSQRLLDGVFERPAAQWVDLPDGHYLLQVRARDAQGLEGRDGRLAFTLKARPEPPFTTAPRDEGRAYGERAEFSWTRVGAAQHYRLQVASESRFEAPLLVDRSDLEATNLAVTLPPGRYHWRIASIAQGNDQGPFSDSASFEMRETPPPPPVDKPKAEGDKTIFRWRARSGDDAYDVQVAHDPAFTQLLLERRENLPELVLDKPKPGTYYLRVRTIESDGFVGPYGSPQEFKVSSSLWWWLAPGAVLLLLM